MYFKGLGNVPQDYNKAIEWFERSDYPMAKHWLGICNYFGYGMPVNKDRALELWLDNPIPNSEIILEHTDANPNLLDLGEQKEKSIKAKEFGASQINSVISEENTNINEVDENLTNENLQGDWQGKLIELDWAQERINRSFPVNLSLSKDEDVNDLKYSLTVGKVTTENLGILLDNSLYLNKATTRLPRLYQDDRDKLYLDYDVLSINTIEVKEINNVRYLIANVETQVKDWHEPGAPMLLVLSNTKTITDNGKEIDEELIAGLLALKKDNFIQNYPNPFKDDLLIYYDLEEEGLTNVEIYRLDGQFSQTIVSNEIQSIGKHLYHLNGGSFINGLYVIRVTVNNKVHTKLIIKE